MWAMDDYVQVRVFSRSDRWGDYWRVSFAFPNGRALGGREFRDMPQACAYLTEMVAWHEAHGRRVLA